MIRLENVIKDYENLSEKNRVLDNLSLEIKKGESISIQGASGSGKTSLIKIILGLSKPTSGRVLINDFNFQSQADFDKWRLENVSYVPQFIDPLPYLDIHHQVELETVSLNIHQKATYMSKFNELMNNLELSDLFDKYPRELSVGQIQRVELIKSLSRGSEILVLDEPTSALDYASATKIIQMIRHEVNANGSTLILATHDIRINQISDRIVTIIDGKIHSTNFTRKSES